MLKFFWTKKQYKIIKKSGIFDENYYKNQISITCDPIKHYIKVGAKLGLNPCKDFDTNFYINTYEDVLKSKLNPLVHFIRIGSKEGRKPCKNAEFNYQIENSNYFVDYKEHTAINSDVKLIAFYLPQFHPFAENDMWWGKGFTEWSNVTKAIANFKGHYQPHLPIHNGFYDLRVPEVMIEQAKLAKNYGIYGFNFYYYWFNGKILMHKPFEILLKHKEIDIKFCITWANENWTRTWDGLEKEVLIEQHHSEEDSKNFINNLFKFFDDERYIKIDNKPVLIIYRADLIPELSNTIKTLRNEAKKAGYSDIYLICTNATKLKKINIDEFDAAMEFPPHNVSQPPILGEIEFLNENFSGNIYDYSKVAINKTKDDEPNYKLLKTAMLSWDNTARRQDTSTIFHNFSLDSYKKWLDFIIKQTAKNNKLSKDEKLVFINAWNEWAEGTHLEPDRKYGYGYLESTYEVLNLNNNQPKEKQ